MEYKLEKMHPNNKARGGNLQARLGSLVTTLSRERALPWACGYSVQPQDRVLIFGIRLGLGLLLGGFSQVRYALPSLPASQYLLRSQPLLAGRRFAPFYSSC